MDCSFILISSFEVRSALRVFAESSTFYSSQEVFSSFILKGQTGTINISETPCD